MLIFIEKNAPLTALPSQTKTQDILDLFKYIYIYNKHKQTNKQKTVFCTWHLPAHLGYKMPAAKVLPDAHASLDPMRAASSW